MRFVPLFGARLKHDYYPNAVCRDLGFEPTAETRHQLEGLSPQAPGVARRGRGLGGEKILEAMANPSVRHLSRIKQKVQAKLQDQDTLYQVVKHLKAP